jgi:hypothetical protein
MRVPVRAGGVLVRQLAVLMRSRGMSLRLFVFTVRMMMCSLMVMVRRGVMMRSSQRVVLMSRMVGHGCTPEPF